MEIKINITDYFLKNTHKSIKRYLFALIGFTLLSIFIILMWESLKIKDPILFVIYVGCFYYFYFMSSNMEFFKILKFDGINYVSMDKLTLSIRNYELKTEPIELGLLFMTTIGIGFLFSYGNALEIPLGFYSLVMLPLQLSLIINAIYRKNKLKLLINELK